jgi:hypothetical protein
MFASIWTIVDENTGIVFLKHLIDCRSKPSAVPYQQ